MNLYFIYLYGLKVHEIITEDPDKFKVLEAWIKDLPRMSRIPLETLYKKHPEKLEILKII